MKNQSVAGVPLSNSCPIRVACAPLPLPMCVSVCVTVSVFVGGVSLRHEYKASTGAASVDSIAATRHERAATVSDALTDISLVGQRRWVCQLFDELFVNFQLGEGKGVVLQWGPV